MIRQVLVVAMLVGCMGSLALADDLNIPDWWFEGGDPWTDPARTFVGWEFELEPDPIPEPIPIPPDFGNNLNGGLQDLIWDPGPDGWLPDLNVVEAPSYDPRVGPWDGWIGTGVVALSGRLEIPVFNDMTLRPEKKVSIQLTWAPQDGQSMPFPGIGVVSAETGGLGYTVTPVMETSTIPLGGGWTHSTYEFSIYPNPMSEVFEIVGDIYVDELIIDTHCVPEPTTLSLLAIGGLGLLALLRRRRSA
ncbi:MAG: PEP-CTERM sorting domain-containing protein [Planctomycetota bacterium]|nr:PEP-CTERM sorting domain-containing protein [Planctomycetota bacterium]